MGITALLVGSSVLLTLALEIAEGRIDARLGTLDGSVAIIATVAFMHADGII